MPAVLHTPWGAWRAYPPAVQERTLRLLLRYLAAGQGMSPSIASNGDA